MLHTLREMLGPKSTAASPRRLLAVLAALAGAIAITCFPLHDMGLVSDDFVYLKLIHFTAVRTLPQEDLGGWWSDFIHWSLNDLFEGNLALRPIRWISVWADYFAWHLQPFGYHLTSVILQLLVSFLVFLLAWQLLRNQWLGFLAALFFAILPIHSSDVAWIAARYHIICALFFTLSFCFYLKRRKPGFYLLSLLAFAAALLSHEVGIILPVVLLAFALVYERHEQNFIRETVKALIPFVLIAAAYIGLRFLLFGRLGNPSYATFDNLALDYKFSGYVMFTTDPLFTDISMVQAIGGAVFLLAVLIFYRSRPAVLFGALWMLITIGAFIAVPAEERYFYIPSIGFVLALAAIVADPLPRWPQVSWRLGLALTLCLIVVYGAASYSRNENWRNASRITGRVVSAVRALHPTLPSDAHLVFVGVPERLRRAFVFLTGISEALQLAYGDPSLQATLADQFPVLTDNLDRTYFFQYTNNKLQERADLVNNLRTRPTCSNGAPAIVWKFTRDAQGWEPWNDVADFGVNAGALEMQVTGPQPMLGGPVVDLDPVHVSAMQITLSARASAPKLQGAVYGQTISMKDFGPALRRTFAIQADGALHTYRLPLDDLAAGLNENIVRLRLDPGNAPADVRIISIAVLCK